MKFIYATDLHLKGRNPARRLDDYPSEILMLFQELRMVATKEGATAVLLGGDIFDTPKISQRLYNKLSRILKQFPCPIVVVPGNHDIFGENPDSLEDTMLGSLEASQVVTLVSEDRPTIDFNGDGTEVTIHGKEYREDRDQDVHNDFTIIPTNSTWNFLMTHQMLLDKPFHPDIDFTLIKDAAQATNADVVFGAHYHPGWGIIEENDVVFIHPGAGARLEGTKVEATRKVQYAIIDVDVDGIDYELKEFKTARDGKDILDLTTNAVAKAHRSALDTFRKTVDDAIKFESLDPHDVLKQVTQDLLQQNVVSSKGTTYAKQALQAAEQDVDELNVGLKGFTEHAGQVSLEWIELENFQSHTKSRFEFDQQGLNAIIGASDSGKTASIRGLRWLLYNDPKGTEFIRHGASRATVRAKFSNGYILERSRTQSSAGHYKITDPAGNETDYTGFSHNVPIEVTNAHQMPKTELAKDVTASLNIAYQLDGPFLMSESASTRASVIGRLTGVHVVDTAIKSTNKKVVGLQRDIKSEEKRETEINERLQNDFNDIPQLEGEVGQLELLIAHAEKLEKKLDSLRRIKRDYQSASDTIRDSQQQLVKMAGPLKKMQLAVAALEEGIKEYRKLVEIRSKLSSAEAIISTATNELKKFRGLSKLSVELSKAEEQIVKVKELNRVADGLAKAGKQLKTIDTDLKKLKNVSSKELDKADELVKKLSDLKRIKHLIAGSSDAIKDADMDMRELDDVIEHGRDQYKEVLKEMGKCPTCFTPIDDSIIDKIEL
jgi:DNA repair protein SbcC/Rad50